jgi:hypothetical protein
VCTGGQAVTCDLCETCDVVAGCITVPRPTCRGPVESKAAQLKVKDSLKGPKNGQVQWKWTTGAATALADFGNPVVSDGLALCIFDRSQATPSLLFRANVPPGGTCDDKPCWVGKGKNFKFKNKTGEPDGATALTLTPGCGGQGEDPVQGEGPGPDRATARRAVAVVAAPAHRAAAIGGRAVLGGVVPAIRRQEERRGGLRRQVGVSSAGGRLDRAPDRV